MKRDRVTVSVDLGNSMLNGATYIDGELKLAKLPNKLQFEKTINPKARVMTKDGNTLYFGVGGLNNNVLKHTRGYLLDQVLVMIHELYPDKECLGVELRTGLPPTQLFNPKYLEAFQNIFDVRGEIEYKINGRYKNVTITSVEVYAEGYSGFIALSEDIKTTQNVLSIDVGGGTTDLCSYKYDYEDDMYYPDVADTVEGGVIDFAEAIANKFNASHEKGADIKADYIDVLLKNNLDVIKYDEKEYSLSDYIDAINPIVDDMLNKITNKYGQLDGYYIVGLGGGYKTFNKHAHQFISQQLESDEEAQFYANVIGYLEQ